MCLPFVDASPDECIESTDSYPWQGQLEKKMHFSTPDTPQPEQRTAEVIRQHQWPCKYQASDSYNLSIPGRSTCTRRVRRNHSSVSCSLDDTFRVV